MTRTGPTGASRGKVTRFLFNPCHCCSSASPAPYALPSCSAPTGGQEPQVGEEEEGSTKAEVQHRLGKFFGGVKAVKAYKN